MQISTIGLDIAKNVFQVHGIDAAEKVVVRKQLRRGQVSARFWLGPDQRITSGPAATAAAFKGRIHGCTRPRSLKCPIFPLHRGRRPYMARNGHADMSVIRSLSGVYRTSQN